MIESLLRILPRKSVDLEAKLTGVNGYTGRGEIEFAIWHNGVRELDIELRGIAGRTADIYAGESHIATVNLEKGKVDYTFSTRKGDAVPVFAAQTLIEVRQNGDVILSGVFAND